MTWGIFKADSVSEAYAKMKSEELKGKQHKLDVNKNGKVDGDDLAKLRATKEEVEQLDELSPGALKSYIKGAKADKAASNDEKSSAESEGDYGTASDAAQRAGKRKEGIKSAKAKLNKEDTEASAEDLVEYESKDGVYKHQAKAGRYGGTEKESDYVKGPSNAALKKIESEKKKKTQKEDLDIFSDREIDMLINEVLSKDASAGEWISDFVKSDNPKFAGKSKEQRKKQALGAYYAAQRNESTDYESFLVLDEAKQDDIVKMGAKEIKHANMKDKQNDQEVMEPHSGTEAKFIDSHSIRVQDDPTQGKFDSGTGKVGTATAPTGKGPGSYDAKEKLGNQKTGVKEEVYKTAAGEEIDTEPTEKKAGDKKKFGSFKASMNKEASDCKTKQ